LVLSGPSAASSCNGIAPGSPASSVLISFYRRLESTLELPEPPRARLTDVSHAASSARERRHVSAILGRGLIIRGHGEKGRRVEWESNALRMCIRQDASWETRSAVVFTSSEHIRYRSRSDANVKQRLERNVGKLVFSEEEQDLCPPCPAVE